MNRDSKAAAAAHDCALEQGVRLQFSGDFHSRLLRAAVATCRLPRDYPEGLNLRELRAKGPGIPRQVVLLHVPGQVRQLENRK